jgi:cathepsin L
MKNAVAISVLSVAVDAQSSFGNYKSGIYAGTDCSTTSVNHGTAVVGWGTASGVDYWLMRNSWGTSWGESGYMRV